MATTRIRHIHPGKKAPMGPMDKPDPSRRYASTHDAICFIPGDRPDPHEESAASQTWREMTAHQREKQRNAV